MTLSGLHADTISDKQQELERINQELERNQQLLQQTKVKEKASLRDLYFINRKITRVKGDLNYNQRRLSQHNQALQQTQEELHKTIQEYRQRQSLLEKRIQEVYKTQELGYLALFFSNKSFSDLVESTYYYRKIMENDVESINHVTSLKQEISHKEVQLQRQKRVIEEVHRNIQQQKQVYEVKAQQQQNIYLTLKAQRRDYERRIEELLRNSKEIEAMIKRLMRESPSIARGSGTYIWPVRGLLTSYYGNRRHPIFKVVKFHTGIDIGANSGVSVKAADSGVVIFAGWWGGYGQAVIIDHGRGKSTVYAHLSRIYMKRGENIDKHQVLGLVGSTGYSTGPHLHFEVRENGETRNPLKYLP